MFDNTPPGVIMGLAWTSMGGSALYIEVTSTNIVPKSGVKPGDADDEDDTEEGSDSESSNGRGGASFRITGQLGDVMQESAQIAKSLATRVLRMVRVRGAGDGCSRFLAAAARCHADTPPLHHTTTG